MWYRFLIAAMIAASATFAVHYGIRDHYVSKAELIETNDGIRGKYLPVVLIIESPLNIANEAVRIGAVSEEHKHRVRGLAWFNKSLTYCRVWLPPLSFDTLWVWVHEIFGHCSKGAFHGLHK